MLIVVASIKASPGATGCALGLAAAWPTTTAPALVVEADAAGGDVAAWFRLNAGSGLVELAALSHSHTGPQQESLFDLCAQPVPVADAVVPVIAGPADPRQAESAVEVLACSAPMILNPAGRCVFADVGRLSMDSSGWSLLKHADAAVIVVSGAAGQIAHLRPLLTELRGVCADRLCVAVRPDVYNAAAVADVLYAAEAHIPVLGDIPHDPALTRGAGTTRASRRSRRGTAAAWNRLASRLSGMTTPAATAIEGARA